jgi:hypothetical protein
MNTTLEFEYTFKEFLEANRTHARRRRYTDIVWYFIATIFVSWAGITVVDAFSEDSKQWEISQVTGVLFAAVFLFLWSPFFFRLMVRKRWKMQPVLHKMIKYEITPDLVRIVTETATAEMTWASFTRFKESKGVFLLYPNKLVFHMIPKRAFASADEIESFRVLVASKIPSPKRRYQLWG